MLGLNRAAGWRFFAGGKHPCAKDFIHLGLQTPLSGSLNDWMLRGFRAEKGEREVASSSILWRFWLRGGRAGEIVCGLLRESGDSIGRAFPLLLVGGGRLPRGERPWQELPLLLSGLWQRMEEVTAPEARDLGSLERGVETLPPPQGDRRVAVKSGAGGTVDGAEGSNPVLPCRLHDAEGFVLLDLNQSENGAPSEEELTAAGRLLSERVSLPPLGAFIGGERAAPRYGILTRPLRTADFATLWARRPRLVPAPDAAEVQV